MEGIPIKTYRLPFATFLLACVIQAGAGAQATAPLKIDHLTFPAKIDGATYTLEATIYRPDDGKAHPLIVMNHGRDGKYPPVNEHESMGYGELNGAFAGRGYVSMMLVRRGYGLSQGPDAELKATAVASGLEAAKDIRAAVDYMREQSYVLRDKVAIVGHSQGGWAAIASASVEMEGVVGAVNLCGGTNYAAMGDGRVTGEVRSHWIRTCGEFGRSAVIPMLWIYAENERILTPESMRNMHQAYQAAGGRARLVIKPPYGTNGHLIVAQPELFIGDIMEFFAEIGLVE